MIKAEWGMDYDWRGDECFKAPMHTECDAPIIKHDAKYICIGCGKEAETSSDMIEWIEARTGEKVETGECISCGKNTMEIHYHKNERTTEWETGYGECKSCGARFIV